MLRRRRLREARPWNANVVPAIVPVRQLVLDMLLTVGAIMGDNLLSSLGAIVIAQTS